MAKQKKEKQATTPLEFTGGTTAKYMISGGRTGRVSPGDIVETPNEFVELRLAEGCWKKVDPKKVEPKKADKAPKSEAKKG
jgi:hypothetical protein